MTTIEDILMDLCEPDTGLLAIGKHDHDAVRAALAEAHQAGVDELVERVTELVSYLCPIYGDERHNKAVLRLQNLHLKALQDNK